MLSLWDEIDSDGDGSARKGPLGFSPVFIPEPRHRLEAYAALLSGMSSEFVELLP
jgi:hypothetical protein